MTTEREQQFLELLKNEVKPALGCTEPIAVSLAVSKASEQIKQLGEDTTMLKVEVSAN
ncbi:MAG: serine dehydratase subunit alpha family protein, partial [Bacteroidia bacterium]|nr:serine dehydratase subunit alpha family protein [Bacteroidia bacterium]